MIPALALSLSLRDVSLHPRDHLADVRVRVSAGDLRNVTVSREWLKWQSGGGRE
jgi:hypothetical protein